MIALLVFVRAHGAYFRVKNGGGVAERGCSLNRCTRANAHRSRRSAEVMPDRGNDLGAPAALAYSRASGNIVCSHAPHEMYHVPSAWLARISTIARRAGIGNFLSRSSSAERSACRAEEGPHAVGVHLVSARLSTCPRSLRGEGGEGSSTREGRTRSFHLQSERIEEAHPAK